MFDEIKKKFILFGSKVVKEFQNVAPNRDGKADIVYLLLTRILRIDYGKYDRTEAV